MRTSTGPYAVPRKLEPDIARVLAYWEELKRGDADMPFWDDVNVSRLPDLSDRLMLIEVFDKPLRFRFGMVGKEIMGQYGDDLAGKFLDETEARGPLRYLNSQSSATVESRAPTYYRHALAKGGDARAGEGYSRLILPMWGDGHVGMLLGAVAWG